jgi:hypothetical protein
MLVTFFEAISNLSSEEKVFALLGIVVLIWLGIRISSGDNLKTLQASAKSPKLLLTFFIATVVFGILLTKQAEPLISAEFEYPIVQFELAKTKVQAENIVSYWEDSENLISVIKNQIRLDFAFPFFYSGFLAIAALQLIRTKKENRSFELFGLVAILSIFAGIFDLVENSFLLMFLERASDLNIQTAFWAAINKFALLFISIVIILFAGYIPVAIDFFRHENN